MLSLSFAAELKLVPGVENYALLNKSGCTTVDTRDDVAEFVAVNVSSVWVCVCVC